MDESLAVSPRSARARKPKRKNDGADEDYIPEGEEHGSNYRIHLGLPIHTTSPTSTSPRSAGHSESSEEHNSDLESLVVAALAEGGDSSKSDPNLANMFDPALMQAQANMLQMMPMMPMMPPIPQMAQPQLMNPTMMGYGFPSFSMDPFSMMHYQMIPIQWRFQGQIMPPLTAPLAYAVRDLIALVYHRLTLDRHIQPSDRVALTVVVNSQRLTLDEPTHGMMPLSMIGLIDPTTTLEVTQLAN